MMVKMNTEEIIKIDDEHSIAGFKKRPIAIVKGEGAKLYDSEGKDYIDCVGGQGVSIIGYGNQRIAKALEAQAKELIICPSLFYNDKKSELLKKLNDITPKTLSRFFFCNSGAEAVEAAIKFARSTTGKTEIISMMRSFHGRTFAALSATAKKEYQEPFQPLVPGFRHVPFNNIEKLKAAIDENTENTAAILLEVIQGEGGVNIAEPEFIKEVRNLCSEKNILMIVDEVQTGFGRTGKMLAVEHYNLEPDILCMAKGIAAGVPMGVVACSDKVKIEYGLHANTFGGYPLTCAAALESISIIQDDNLCKESEEKGQYFIDKLKTIKSPNIRNVRGKGLMIAVELKEKSGPYITKLMEEGIMVLSAGKTCLRFLPPLVITKEEINIVVEKVRMVLSDE